MVALSKRLGAPLTALAMTFSIGCVVEVGDEHSAEREPFSVDEASSAEWDFLKRLNQERQARGLNTLPMQKQLRGVARDWSRQMAAESELYHNPQLASDVSGRVTSNWQGLGENVGRGFSVRSLHDAFMNSTRHRENILRDWDYVGVGVELAGQAYWVTFNFLRSSASLAVLSPPATGGDVGQGLTWHLRNAHSGGSAHKSFGYGQPGDIPVVGDWDGDGTDGIGVVRGNTWYLRQTPSAGPAQVVFRYGTDTDLPIVGDWNGNSKDTPGVVRGNTFYLRNALSGGSAHVAFSYGRASDQPIAGDWNGDGRDTVGMVRGDNLYLLRNRLSGGSADVSFYYGGSGDEPIAGDWDGDGDVTVGVRRGAAWLLSNQNKGGTADLSYTYGWASDVPVVGDWDGDGRTTAGIVR